jgi:hypothetical protein
VFKTGSAIQNEQANNLYHQQLIVVHRSLLYHMHEYEWECANINDNAQVKLTSHAGFECNGLHH